MYIKYRLKMLKLMKGVKMFFWFVDYEEFGLIYEINEDFFSLNYNVERFETIDMLCYVGY
jgi:hypothetical protein